MVYCKGNYHITKQYVHKILKRYIDRKIEDDWRDRWKGGRGDTGETSKKVLIVAISRQWVFKQHKCAFLFFTHFSVKTK